MSLNLPESAILYASDAHGVYIPQYFAESIKRDCVTGVTQEQWDVIAQDPNGESAPEFYWDVWTEIEDSAVVTDPSNGIAYRLYQDGDLWLVPVDWTPRDDDDDN